MDETRKQFLDVVQGVLERFTFMFMEVDDDRALGECPGDYLHAAITFTGSRQGTVTLTAPESLCQEMAANVLGVEPGEAGPEIREDALKELANIICGELTVVLFGSREVFDLSVPLMCRIDCGKWRELAMDRENVRLWVEDKPVLATLTLAGKL